MVLRKTDWIRTWSAALMLTAVTAQTGTAAERAEAKQSADAPAAQGAAEAPWSKGTAMVSDVRPCPSPSGAPSYCNPDNIYRPTEPGTMFDPQTAPDGAMPAPATSSASQFTAASVSDTVTPNMVGDLLRAYRGVSFQYLLAGDQAPVNASGVVTFRNTSVAENNSAIPRDRVTFRYNYFHNALDVSGLKANGTRDVMTDIFRLPGDPNPPVNLDDPTTFRRGIAGGFNGTGNLPPNPSHSLGGPPQTVTQTLVRPGKQAYDAHLYTLGFEKTVAEGLGSVEVRLPIAQTLSPDLNLEAGFVDPENLFAFSTPGATLGTTDTQIQDLQLIFKALLYQSKRVAFAGGMGVTAPTGPNLSVRVVDFSNDEGLDLNPRDPIFNELTGLVSPDNAIDRRVRNFHVDNDTWAIAPFLAMTATPTDRTFVNGFLQLDVPLNESDWRYSSIDIDLARATAIVIPPNPMTMFPGGFAEHPVGAIQNAEYFEGSIRDQMLMHLNVGGGFWMYQNPCARMLTGLAALFEVHYTTTLQDADIVEVPAQRLRANRGPQDDMGNFVGIDEQEDRPLIGNIGNRVDILNGTVGTTMVLSDRATVALAYVFPIRKDAFDKQFDGELNLQVNYYFGASRSSLTRFPNY